MSRSLNMVSLIGNVGQDPEIRSTSSGNRLARLSLATNESWTDRSGQRQEATEWHRITVWGKLVDVVELWVKKGDRLFIQGKLKYSTFQCDCGKDKHGTEIVVSGFNTQLIMLGSSGGGGGGEPFRSDDYPEPAPSGGGGGGGRRSGPDDDLPF